MVTKTSSVEKIYTLTPLQQGMAFQKLKDNNGTDYHVQNSFWINKELDEGKIQASLRLLVKKHEVLRTAIVLPKTTGVYKQVILSERPIEYHHLTIDDAIEEDKTKKIISDDLARQFDFEKESLLRVYHLTIIDKRHWFLFSFHHIIMDGWCTSLLLDDFMRFTEMLSDMSEEQVLDCIDKENAQIGTYADFVQWLDGNNKNQGIEFWTKYLEGYDAVARINSMKKAGVHDEQMNCLQFSLGNKASELLMEKAKAFSVTINSVLESAWGLLLQGYTYSDDVVFSKIISGRDIPIKGAEKILGLFINSIPCRVQSLPGMTVGNLWKLMYEKSLKCTDYQFCPLAEIQSATKLGQNLINSVIAFENYFQTDIKIFVEKDFSREQTDYQLTVNFYQDDESLHYNILYDPNEIIQTEVSDIGDILKKILISMSEDSDRLLADIDFVSDSSLNKIKTKFNQVGTKEIFDKSIIHYFKEQVRKHGDRIAVTYLDQKLTYDELDQKSNAVARELVDSGVCANDFVAIISEKSLEVVIGIYGILKTGATYVPISLDYPEKRIRTILEDCKPKVILYNNKIIEGSIKSICIKDLESADFESVDISANNLAYIIYTSGTTGIPKGVMIKQTSVVNLVKNCNYTTLNEDSVILQTGDISFDASTFEIHGALLNGGKICLINKEVLLDIDLLKKEIAEKAINTMFITTALFNQLLSIDETIFDGLKYLMFGGEQTNEKYVQMLVDRRLGLEFSNVYGPTETTTFATHYPIHEAAKKTPIGKPLQNVKIFVLNKNRLCGIGIPGELCIAGLGVAEGYLNRPEITEKTFIETKFCEGKMYRTGDLVRWLEDGNIEFLGRIDNQIKLNGFRIELDEISTVLTSVDGISEAITLIRKIADDSRHIVSYVVSKRKIDIPGVKREVGKSLPKYMLPSFVIQMDKLPLNANGKIDTTALPEVKVTIKKEYKKPENETQQLICYIIGTVLSLEQVSITDNIYELGCDSITSMKLLTQLKKKGFALTISDLYSYPTVKELSLLINQKNEIEEADKEDDECIFEEMDDIKSFLKNEISRYEKEVLKEEAIKKVSMTACQKRMCGNLILMSGTAIKFENEFNIFKLRECVKHVIERQEVLRSGLLKNKLVVHEIMNEYDIPYINLKNAPDLLKEEVKKYMSGEFFRLSPEIRNKEILLHRIAAVKYSSQECYLYFPISHLIFDAMSGELLYSNITRNYYTNAVQSLEKINTFSDYAEQLVKGPKSLKVREIMDKLHIKKYADALVELGKNDTRKLENYYINLMLGTNADCISKEKLWDISFKLFEKLLRYNYQIEKFPTFIICVNRKYEDQSYYKTMGLFVDVMPVLIKKDNEIDLGYVQEMMKWMSCKNFCFTTLLLTKRVLLKYICILIPFLKALPYMNSVPTFNYLDMYAEMEEQAQEIDTESYLAETDIVTKTVDFKILEDSIQILAYGPEGDKAGMESYLQHELKEIMEQYGLSKEGGW